jgi:hypothetical protein
MSQLVRQYRLWNITRANAPLQWTTTLLPFTHSLAPIVSEDEARATRCYSTYPTQHYYPKASVSTNFADSQPTLSISGAASSQQHPRSAWSRHELETLFDAEPSISTAPDILQPPRPSHPDSQFTREELMSSANLTSAIQPEDNELQPESRTSIFARIKTLVGSFSFESRSSWSFGRNTGLPNERVVTPLAASPLNAEIEQIDVPNKASDNLLTRPYILDDDMEMIDE